jgi:hypothetical protein
MATAPIASFAPTAAVEMAVSTTSSQVALPTAGTPTIALVTNLGIQPVFLALGTSSSVSVVAGAGVVVMPGQPLALTIGANTNVAAIALAGVSGLNIAVGT